MSISNHPVQLHVRRAERVPRLEAALRVVLVLALAIIAWSSIYWLLYLALPAAVALDLRQNGPDAFLGRDAPRLVRALRWLVGAEAFLYFLTNELPTSSGGAVDLHVRVEAHAPAGPTASSALMRLVSSVPALLLVGILMAVSSLVWLLAALSALVTERIPPFIGDFFLFVLRVKYRLIAYHLSLVDRYPLLAGDGLDQPIAT